jgi:hypothetical protein
VADTNVFPEDDGTNAKIGGGEVGGNNIRGRGDDVLDGAIDDDGGVGVITPEDDEVEEGTGPDADGVVVTVGRPERTRRPRADNAPDEEDEDSLELPPLFKVLVTSLLSDANCLEGTNAAARRNAAICSCVNADDADDNNDGVATVTNGSIPRTLKGVRGGTNFEVDL